MPLPKALAARLAKRGLLKINSQSNDSGRSLTNQEVSTPVHEEIIAEDYDEETPQSNSIGPYPPNSFEKYKGWYACPNKWNVYHECTINCQELWKNIKEIDKDYNKRRLKMLLKFPLTDHWREILEVGLGRYYYWNTETNLVSWLPPSHPKCQVSLSAADLRKNMVQERDQRLKEEKEISKSDDEQISDNDDDDTEDSNQKVNDKRLDSAGESEDDAKDRKKRDHKETSRNSRRKRRKMDEEVLDPMDPAAYSDCPRGNWSSGLEDKNEARTGVDTTASGPLFQMRPYPNPGAILRANAASGNAGAGPIKPS